MNGRIDSLNRINSEIKLQLNNQISEVTRLNVSLTGVEAEKKQLKRELDEKDALVKSQLKRESIIQQLIERSTCYSLDEESTVLNSVSKDLMSDKITIESTGRNELETYCESTNEWFFYSFGIPGKELLVNSSYYTGGIGSDSKIELFIYNEITSEIEELSLDMPCECATVKLFDTDREKYLDFEYKNSMIAIEFMCNRSQDSFGDEIWRFVYNVSDGTGKLEETRLIEKP
ncbi:MAG: hypothetical protein ACK45H_02580, partial [Bacteroidota bacterium]